MASHYVKLANMHHSTAYWIAFGPHGPRAVDPPGTNARIAWGVAIGLAASFTIFAAIRLAAKPEPHTMSKEYQEASNELLIVSCELARLILSVNPRWLTLHVATKSRSYHWYFFPKVRGQGYGSVSP